MKRIISSSLLTIAALAVIVGGTGAFFSDTETSEGNVFTAGAIDLFINHTAASYNGVDCSTCETTVFSEVGDTITKKDGETLPEPIDAVAAAQPSVWADETNLSSNATWIWATSTRPAPDDDTSYTFAKEFVWYGNTGNVQLDLELAADDEYQVYVNGTPVNAQGSNAFSSFETHTFNIGNEINQGQNVIEFQVTNSGGYFAGLVYELTIEDLDCEEGIAGYQAQCELWDSRDLTTESFFDFADVKPQDHGTNLISMTVEDNESFICLQVDEDEQASTPGNGGGNLGDFLEVVGWYADSDGDIIGTTPAFGPTTISDLGSVPYADSNSSAVTPGDTEYLLLEWCMGDLTVDGTAVSCDGNVTNINDTQAAELIADLQFYAVQSRNNDKFICDTAEFGSVEPDDTPL